jgi:hypothetical protein
MATNALGAGLRLDMGALPITAGADSGDIPDLKSQISQRQSDIRGAETRREEALKKSEATLAPLRESLDRAQQAELEATRAPLPTMKEARQPIPPDVRMPLDKLFMMIMTAAFASSAAGKKNYLAAASGLTGALEGIQNGQKEAAATALKQYDQAMKAALAEDQKNLRQYNAIMSQRNKDIQTKITEAKMYATQIQNEVHRSQLETGQIDRFIQNANNSVDTMNREVARLQTTARLAAERAQQFQQSEARRKEEAEQRSKDRERQFGITERRLQLAEEKAASKGEGRALNEPQLKKIQGQDSLAAGLQKLKADFKDEYAGLGVFGFGADLSLEAKRRLGDEKGQQAVSWWSRYNMLQAPNRHALFGATLTGNELRNYQSFTAKPSDNASAVKGFLQDQINFVNDTKNTTENSYEAAGYRVPKTKTNVGFEETYSQSMPSGIPPGATKIGTTPQGKDVYQAPDGKKYTAD